MNELQELSFEQLRLVSVVYTSALLPLFLIPYLSWKNKMPKWSLKVYIASFLICALGWEIWFTYGLWAGDPVDIRRAAVLNHYVPKHLNWFLNSLADAGSICMIGIFYVWLLHRRNLDVLRSWRWSVFFTFLIYFIGQNIIVEMFLYMISSVLTKHFLGHLLHQLVLGSIQHYLNLTIGRLHFKDNYLGLF